MANNQNLVSLATRPLRERQEIAKKGSLARIEQVKRRKTLREELLILLGENNNQQNISIALINKAKYGDTKAFEVIQAAVGEKPTDKIEQINVDVSLEQYLDKVVEDNEY